MDKMPILSLLLLAFPEGAISTSLGMTLTGVKPSWFGALRIGLVYMVCAFFMRRYMPPGFHSVAILILMVSVLMIIARLSFKKAFTATIVAFLFLVLGEAVTLPVFTRMLDVTITEILTDHKLRVAASVPTHLFLLAVMFLGYRIRGFHKQAGTDVADESAEL